MGRALFFGAMVWAAAACDDGGEASVDAAPMADMGEAGLMVDAAPAGDPLTEYCERTAQARCEWAFECVGGGPDLWTTFGLAGPDVAGCVAPLVEACVADVQGREARGTLMFTAAAVDACVNGLRGAPCPDGEPGDWVEQWYAFTYSRCATVVRGTQVSGAGCEVKADCQDEQHICADGDCRAPRSADIQQDCDALGATFGESNYDRACPGELCVQPGNNEQGKAGVCSADCRYGLGCPGGDACLRISAPGSPPTWYCIHPCEQDRDCANGLTCRFTDPGNIANRSKHCWTTPGE